MIGIRIPRKIGQRLESLALRTGRNKTYYIREAIMSLFKPIPSAILCTAYSHCYAVFGRCILIA
ncbi:MAG: ribbon-helix-helix protein, CopG family [Chlorobiaceae bacterium]